MTKLSIAENIKRLRDKAKLSREGLGRLCVPPISYRTVESLEKGGNTYLDVLDRVCVALKVPRNSVQPPIPAERYL